MHLWIMVNIYRVALKEHLDFRFGILVFTVGFLLSGLLACKNKVNKTEIVTTYKELVLDSLAHPWGMAFINKDEAYISEKDGDILRVNLATKARDRLRGFPKDLFTAPLIDVSKHPPRTYPTSLDGRRIRGNGGILDVKLDPEYTTTSKLFVSYVSEKQETFALKVISAIVVNDSLTDIQTILNPGPYVPGIWHFGGGLCVQGKYLFVTVGERLFFEDLKQGLAIAQDVTDARGAVYRVFLDGKIPLDNPDFGPNAIPGIYAFGIRAAQGITIRPDTDEIWFSEHGTNQGDEINKLEKGANYGWPNITTGTWRSINYQPEELTDPDYVDPRHYWLHTVAPTGLTFYTGHEFPSWHGSLMVPGLSRGSLWRLGLDNDIITSAEELFLNDRVRSRKVIQSPDGHLYLLTDEHNGKLIRIINKTKTHEN